MKILQNEEPKDNSYYHLYFHSNLVHCVQLRQKKSHQIFISLPEEKVDKLLPHNKVLKFDLFVSYLQIFVKLTFSFNICNN